MQLGGGSHMTRYPEKHTAVKVSGTGKLWLSEMGAGQPSAWSWEQEVWDGRFSASRVRWWWQIFLDGAIFFHHDFLLQSTVWCRNSYSHNFLLSLCRKHLSLCTPKSCLCCSPEEWLCQGCEACIMLMHSSWSGSYSGERTLTVEEWPFLRELRLPCGPSSIQRFFFYPCCNNTNNKTFVGCRNHTLPTEKGLSLFFQNTKIKQTSSFSPCFSPLAFFPTQTKIGFTAEGYLSVSDPLPLLSMAFLYCSFLLTESCMETKHSLVQNQSMP